MEAFKQNNKTIKLSVHAYIYIYIHYNHTHTKRKPLQIEKQYLIETILSPFCLSTLKSYPYLGWEYFPFFLNDNIII